MSRKSIILLIIGVLCHQGKALECYFCEIGDQSCSSTELGSEISCSNDPGNVNFGDACMVEHIVKIDGSGEPKIHEWQRKCVSKTEFPLGCIKKDGDGPGSSDSICVCENSLCNSYLNNSVNPKPKEEVHVLTCYVCNETEAGCKEEPEDAKIVECQLNDPDGPNYGNACLVGHNVENGTESPPKYRRSCAYTSFKNIGCSQRDEYLNGKAMVVDVCYCDTDECNKMMGPIEPSTKSPETSTKENEGLQCYYCASDDHNYGDCDAEHGGEIVNCQTEDKNAPHYGHTCAVGHTVDIEENIWRRDCFTPEDGYVGCKQDSRENGTHSWNIEICVCEGNLCNEKMSDIPTSSTSKSTTHKEGILECYYCQENGGEEHDVCTADEIGSPVECQTNDPEGKHYGDVCAVGHAVENASMPGGMTWRRDCAMKGDKELGCRDGDFHTPDGDIKVYECLCEGSLCNKYTDEETSTQKTTTVHGNGLECYFCLSDDHNLGDCDSEHAGSPVTCSDNPDDLHYGDKCSVGHTVAEGDQIWRRDCIKTDFTGCKADKRDNGTHQWDIEWCVCEEPLCNMKMGDVSTSSTAKTTTSQVTDLKCYYCNSQDEEHSDCSADEDGELVSCQYNDSKDEHYGNACIVGHTVDKEKVYWGRDCVDASKIEIGCSEQQYQNVTIEVCVCKEEGCNNKMDISTTTNKAPTTTHNDPNQLECYYCYGHAGTEHDNCDEDIPGDKVVCQMHDPRQPNYGDACFIGHTEKSPEAGSMTWRRGCQVRGSKHNGCEEYKWEGGNVTVIECVCSDALCNKDIPDVPTTTPGSGLQCYSCGHDEEMCSVSSTGPKVYCQTDDPETRNYGDSCYVGHSVHQNISEEHWWRGCKMAEGEPTECTQHEFVHHGHNVTVDECICKGDLCNKNMTYDPTSPPNPHNGSCKTEINFAIWLILTMLALLMIDN